ncbi:hypothetical protein PLUTE_a5142 [Pseudoalteromonas luteoviolacea DSM 6061]|nr:hypothetical protein [Pseudoalteromonas luteoviolacea DSM 6061]
MGFTNLFLISTRFHYVEGVFTGGLKIIWVLEKNQHSSI